MPVIGSVQVRSGAVVAEVKGDRAVPLPSAPRAGSHAPSMQSGKAVANSTQKQVARLNCMERSPNSRSLAALFSLRGLARPLPYVAGPHLWRRVVLPFAQNSEGPP